MGMEKHTVILEKDFVVIGGGLAGVCAAISAARHGLRVALCQDRSVLGGNSSSECRVWACGAAAMGFNRYADETGIISELLQENLRRNPDGNPHLWDALLLDRVWAEENILLLLETRMLRVETEAGLVHCVECEQFPTETVYRITAPFFADCSGDAVLAHLAGAATTMGNADIPPETRRRYGLSDDYSSLGSTVLFYSKRADHPVPFIAPDFAYSVDEIDEILRRTGKLVSATDTGCDYWWLEYGGSLDTIRDSEDIRRTLLRLVYGVWNYIKNSGCFNADHLELEWVGSMPARRESRRAIGLYTLTEEDIFTERVFDDAVCHGGWPIDTHPSAGFFDRNESCNQIPVDPYDIPLSSLIVRDAANVLIAGRGAGMNHLAMASARVMKTCAVEGQAIGTAAACALRWNTTPARFSGSQLHALQNTLLRDDVWIPGRRLDADTDIAQRMRVSASAPLRPDTGFTGRYFRFERKAYIMLPPLKAGARVSLHLSAEAAFDCVLSLYESGKDFVYKPNRLVLERAFPLHAGDNAVALICPRDTQGNTCILVPPHTGLSIGLAEEPLPGMLGVFSDNALGTDLFAPAVSLNGMDNLYDGRTLNDGYTRPCGGIHTWVSPLGEAWAELSTDAPVAAGKIVIFLENALYRSNNHLRPLCDPLWNATLHPGLLRDLDVVVSGPCYEKTFAIRDNVNRHIAIPQPNALVSRIRLLPIATHGASYAAVHEIALFPPEE